MVILEFKNMNLLDLGVSSKGLSLSDCHDGKSNQFQFPYMVIAAPTQLPFGESYWLWQNLSFAVRKSSVAESGKRYKIVVS
jgi:hypothetical protein